MSKRLLEYLVSGDNIQEYEKKVTRLARGASYAFLTGWYSGMLRELVIAIGKDRAIRLVSSLVDIDETVERVER